VHFSRSLPSNSWWQTMVGWQVRSRPSAAEGGGRRPAFTGPATRPYSATEVDGWQRLSRVSQNRAAVHVKGVIEAVAEIGRRELKKTGVFVMPGLAKFIVIKKPATKARPGINPFTKEPTVFKAKPARKIVRVRPVKAAKDAVA
jgi:DNA-binding protein HU-beta